MTDVTCLPNNVLDMATAKRRRLKVLAGGGEQANPASCLICHGSGRVQRGMVTDPDEATGLRSVVWPRPPVAVACSHPTSPDGGDAA